MLSIPQTWMYNPNKMNSCKIENIDRAYNANEPINLFKNKYFININKNIELKTILIPVTKIDNINNGDVKLILVDNNTNQVYEAYNNNIYNNRGFVAFNLTKIDKKDSYHFTLYSLTDNTYGFVFSDDKNILVQYTYYKN